jgi:hypothetical protein
MVRRIASYVVILCPLVMSAQMGWSQAVTGTLLGTVTDTSGAIVPNANVTATEVNTRISSRTSTNGRRYLHNPISATRDLSH